MVPPQITDVARMFYMCAMSTATFSTISANTPGGQGMTMTITPLVHCGQSKTWDPYVIRLKQEKNGFHHLVEKCFLFHICSKNVQLNKIKTFLLMIFAEMTNKKEMLLPQ